ncbi:hypothetical protein EZL74_00045 [Flavobacterium silvisoli]|uniref:Glycine zipper family protein n=1 Tax=Flavobacterium silvisoli TaxID=2529433 RepID=A0A4Q9Z626_9FLAO|nr:hypothetical protein [Flavobacterium silvisoli]TBX70926.1 hypothetical protein EZL74_00045 [Flavobacterium silvisoli]
MKKLVLGIIATVSFAFNAVSQENNPYNKVGDDFVEAYKVVASDYANGKIKEVNQEMLDNYSQKLSFGYSISTTDFYKIVEGVKDINAEEAVKRTALTDFSKEVLLKSLKTEDLSNLVDEVNKSDISRTEKEKVLSSLAILNAVNTHPQVFTNTANRCWICWVAIGVITGNVICELPCAIIGGIIGAIFGGHEKDTKSDKVNPYNSVGVDFVASAKTLQNDYNEGKIKAIDKGTTDYYQSILPLKTEVTEEVISATINAIKASNYKEVVMNSKLSDFSKNILLESQTNSPDFTVLVEKVNNNNKLSESEREMVLTSLALTQNLNQTSALSRCTINGQTGPNACQAAGALSGFIIGEAICGPLCGLGGAIIGAIFGSTKD